MSGNIPKNILVVDDDPYYCGELVSAILRAGYRTSMAGNTQDALLLLTGPQRFDLVFLDVGSPDMSARGLLTSIQEEMISTPVFTVAAPSDKVFIIDMLRKGHKRFIEHYMMSAAAGTRTPGRAG
jgi:DNA-binding NtrC family response regulator